jgi:D-amino peptidase
MQRMRAICGLVVASSAVGFATPCTAGSRVMVFIDDEGIIGVMQPEHKAASGPEGAEFRRVLMKEVNAAIEGAIESGATKLTVVDTSGAVSLTELNPASSLVRGDLFGVQPCAFMASGYDAIIALGAHASVGTVGAIMPHSFAKFKDLRLNGVHASETLILAACAAHYKVPVVLVSGDDKAVDECKRTISPQIVGVEVKKSYARFAGEQIPLQEALARVRDGSKQAISRVGTFRPYELKPTSTIDITFADAADADGMAMLPMPGLQRVDSSSYRFTTSNIIDAVRFCLFAARYTFGKGEAKPAH